jgi:hypothetical protein
MRTLSSQAAATRQETDGQPRTVLSLLSCRNESQPSSSWLPHCLSLWQERRARRWRRRAPCTRHKKGAARRLRAHPTTAARERHRPSLFRSKRSSCVPSNSLQPRPSCPRMFRRCSRLRLSGRWLALRPAAQTSTVSSASFCFDASVGSVRPHRRAQARSRS